MFTKRWCRLNLGVALAVEILSQLKFVNISEITKADWPWEFGLIICVREFYIAHNTFHAEHHRSCFVGFEDELYLLGKDHFKQH